MIITPTPQQTEFYNTSRGKGSVALKARAGTGKTYSEQQWALQCKSSGISTSFSRGTVQELGKKMPRKFPARTIHSLCLSVLKDAGHFQKTDTSKLYTITKSVIDAAEASWELQAPVMGLVRLAKTFGLIPFENLRDGLVPDEPAEWENLADHFDIPFNEETLHLARAVLLESNRQALSEGIIDFDDMLYIALLWPHRFPRFPVVIADEVQDFNALQHTCLQRIMMSGGRLIVAGDDRQAIYAFRGALADSYGELVTKFSMTEMPLTVSFRCPAAVIKEAQKYVPDIEVSPHAISGKVLEHDDLDIHDVPRAVLCRNNAPLIRLALKLLVNGRTAEVAGQDIGKGLIALTKRITKRNLPSAEFVGRLHKWATREIDRKPKSKARVRDKVAALEALAETHKDLGSMQAHLSKLYPNPQAKNYKPAEVHLSTIHKAKGREWPHVLFLDPQLLPSKYAVQDWEILQESNLAYVGITRAQETLHYCRSEAIM